MDKGLITNPKDLERMQHELQSLERRIASLEDDELEVMARVEDAQRELDSLTAQVQAADERLATLATARDEKQAEIDAELSKATAERATAVEGMPAVIRLAVDRRLSLADRPLSRNQSPEKRFRPRFRRVALIAVFGAQAVLRGGGPFPSLRARHRIARRMF